MRLTPWKPKQNWIEPFDSFNDLHKDINRLFDYATARDDQFNKLLGSFSPSVDVYDEKDRIRVKADLPGMEKDQIDVTAEDGVLTIKGEKKDEKKTKESGCVCSERVFGSFYRSFTLPRGIDTQKIEASFKSGVLEVILPKKEEAKPRQIKVNVK